MIFNLDTLRLATGRRTASQRISGLTRLAGLLVECYVRGDPSDVIRKIEELHPAKNPERSPIPEIRMRYQLEKMGLDELRKMAMENVGDEKQWLINRIMVNKGLSTNKVDCDEAATAENRATTSQKRELGELGTDDENNGEPKRPRAVL